MLKKEMNNSYITWKTNNIFKKHCNLSYKMGIMDSVEII